jgi:hypothetical protein
MFQFQLPKVAAAGWRSGYEVCLVFGDKKALFRTQKR